MIEVKNNLRGIGAGLLALFFIVASAQAGAQESQTASSPGKGSLAQGEAKKGEDGAKVAAGSQTPDDNGEMVKGMFRRFYDTYRLGPGDELAVRVKGQPEYSLEKVKLSPGGGFYHPLLGEVQVGGLTIDQLTKQLTTDLSEYILDPIVNVELLEANSAKIGVIGEVPRPGIFVMARPMTVLDAITEAGGFAPTGKSSNVSVLRLMADGRRQQMKVNLKEVLQGKAAPEENLTLQAGDTVVVHGNAMKTIAAISTVASLGSVLSFIAFGVR